MKHLNLHPLVPDRWRVARWFSAGGVNAIPPVVWVTLELAAALTIAHLSWADFERRFLSLKKKAPRARARQAQRVTE